MILGTTVLLALVLSAIWLERAMYEHAVWALLVGIVIVLIGIYGEVHKLRKR